MLAASADASAHFFTAVSQRPATDKASDDDASTAPIPVFETDDYHAVAAKTASPAFRTIVGADAAAGYELISVTGGAEVVVAGVAAEAVVASV